MVSPIVSCSAVLAGDPLAEFPVSPTDERWTLVTPGDGVWTEDVSEAASVLGGTEPSMFEAGKYTCGESEALVADS